MKKLFSFVWIVFTLLAGFSACGNNDLNDIGDTNNDSESVGDTAYGVMYSIYYNISGVIVNEENDPLENINVKICLLSYPECKQVAQSDTKGKFEFTEQEQEADYIRRKVKLELVDPDKEYASHTAEVSLKCESNHCESDDIKLTMHEWTGDDKDTYESIDSDHPDDTNDDSDQ